MKIKVEIEWDKPKQKGWLNVFNIEYCLRQVCPNTRFKVKDLKTGIVSKDSWKKK